MRAQYHLRESPQGLLAWDVHRLADLASRLTPEIIPLGKIRELDEPFWQTGGNGPLTCREIAEHAKLIDDTDLQYPVIVDPDGRVMDGMHRVCKALNLGMNGISAYRLPELPEPDFVGVMPEDLPYEDEMILPE